MAALSAFYPLIAPRVPGAPAPAITASALEGAIEFCARTLTLQRKLTAVNTVANQAAYTLTQAGEVIEKLLGAKLSGQPLRLPLQADLDDDEDPTLSASAPSELLLTGPMQVTLVPPPSLAGLPLVVRAAMRPAQAATTVDDVLFERHAQAIADFALHKLKSASKDTPYYDASGADLAMTRFLEAVGREKAKVLRERARSKARPRVLWC
jgi:hypothetical protein